MGRLLLIIAIVAVVFWWFKSARKRQQQQDRPDVQPPEAEDMVRCAKCGVHLPKNESYSVGGKFYCSEAHSRSHTGQSD
jgi:uncharacterized protein